MFMSGALSVIRPSIVNFCIFDISSETTKPMLKLCMSDPTYGIYIKSSQNSDLMFNMATTVSIFRIPLKAIFFQNVLKFGVGVIIIGA